LGNEIKEAIDPVKTARNYDNNSRSDLHNRAHECNLYRRNEPVCGGTMKSDPKHIFDEYIVQCETSWKQRAHWQIAIGLQGVDKQTSYQMASSSQSAIPKCHRGTLGKKMEWFICYCF
jgi:hypothetical protein